jgi:hypothetical protein
MWVTDRKISINFNFFLYEIRVKLYETYKAQKFESHKLLTKEFNFVLIQTKFTNNDRNVMHLNPWSIASLWSLGLSGLLKSSYK